MKNIPKYIFLQIGEDCECDDWNKVYPSHDVTWQDEKIHCNDIKFERVDVPSEEQNNRMREWFKARTGLKSGLLSVHMKALDKMLEGKDEK